MPNAQLQQLKPAIAEMPGSYQEVIQITLNSLSGLGSK